MQAMGGTPVAVCRQVEMCGFSKLAAGPGWGKGSAVVSSVPGLFGPNQPNCAINKGGGPGVLLLCRIGSVLFMALGLLQIPGLLYTYKPLRMPRWTLASWRYAWAATLQ